MTTGRGRHIDSIDIGIVYEFLRISIPLSDTMLDGIGTGTFLRTAHHSDNTGAFHFRECRTTFDLRHLTTTDESPSQYLHSIPFVLGNS